MLVEAGVRGREALPRSSDAPIETAILGGGPAGLTAGYVLGLRGRPGAVFEADPVVGGLARTVERNGYRFDLGGHRFFTKLAPIERLWEQMLGPELLTRPRMSRIYYDGRYFAYPLEARDVVGRLGPVEAALCLASYAAGKARRHGDPETFEEWVTMRFGRRIYDAFFRSYTQKVWGIPGSEIRSQWAAQRIKDFSLGVAILSMLRLRRRTVTTLIEEFRYPRLGPGQMWDTFHARVTELGVPVHLGARCVGLRHRDGLVESVVIAQDGGLVEHAVGGVVSSMPLRDLVLALDPPAPPEVLEAARALRYRSLCVVALMTTEAEPFPDNWIYVHDPDTRAARVQNFGAWSPGMVVPGTTALGAEYFCFEGDDLWQMGEREAVALATRELAGIGLLDPARVTGGAKVDVARAYPVYDADFEDAVAMLRDYVATLANVEVCGRNGLHRYNNQDHSMWTAILATLNRVDDADHDVWSVNAEAEYLEDGAIVDELLETELACRPSA